MPFVIPFIPLIAAATTATVGGLQMAGVGRPDTPKPIDPTKQPLTASQNQSQQAAVSQALPNLQSLTGGSLSPEYAAQFGATQAGLGNDPKATGNIQEAINQFFGLTAGVTSGLSPSSSVAPSGGGIMDLIKLPPSTGGGTPGVTGGSDWVTQALQGNDFRGLAG